MARLSFRKSIKIAPGVRLNVTHRGLSSISAGAGGVRVSQSLRGSSTRSRGGAAASAGPSFTERVKADDARRMARLEAKLGADGVERRRQLNKSILLWGLVANLWAWGLALPLLWLAALPLTVWAIVRGVRLRRAQRESATAASS